MAAQFVVATGGANSSAVAPATASTYVTTTAAAAKSLWLLNPVTNEFVITSLSIGFDGSVAAAPILVMLYRTVTLGSPAGTTGTVQKIRPGSQVATTTALTNLTTEATSIDVLDAWPVAANNGLLVIQYPLGREAFGVAAGARIGLLIKTPTGVNPQASSAVWWEE